MYVINLNDRKSKRAHWISLFIEKNTVAYFHSFRNEYISQTASSKSKANHSLKISLDYNLIIPLCVNFIVSIL